MFGIYKCFLRFNFNPRGREFRLAATASVDENIQFLFGMCAREAWNGRQARGECEFVAAHN